MKSEMTHRKNNLMDLEAKAKKAVEAYLDASANFGLFIYNFYREKKGLVSFDSFANEENNDEGK